MEVDIQPIMASKPTKPKGMLNWAKDWLKTQDITGSKANLKKFEDRLNEYYAKKDEILNQPRTLENPYMGTSNLIDLARRYPDVAKFDEDMLRYKNSGDWDYNADSMYKMLDIAKAQDLDRKRKASEENLKSLKEKGKLLDEEIKKKKDAQKDIDEIDLKVEGESNEEKGKFQKKLKEENKGSFIDAMAQHYINNESNPKLKDKSKDELLELSHGDFNQKSKSDLFSGDENREIHRDAILERVQKIKEKDKDLKQEVRDEYAGMSDDEVIAHYAEKYKKPLLEKSSPADAKKAIDKMDYEIDAKAKKSLGIKQRSWLP